MKKILFFIFAALAFVACKKETPGDTFVRYSPQAFKLDRAVGGNAVVTAGIETFPAYIVPYKIDDNSFSENVIFLWEKHLPTAEEIRSVGKYEAHGCKISLSDDFKQYTIEVEKDCEWDYLEVYTKWVDGYPAPSVFYIVLNPELYDEFRE